MEETQFDELTRTLAQRPSRRGVLTAVAAGVAVLVGVDQTAEARRHRVRAQARGRGPDPCAVRCADEPKARGAQCRQACKACANPGCLSYSAATGFTCCGGNAAHCLSTGYCLQTCDIVPDSCPGGCVCLQRVEGGEPINENVCTSGGCFGPGCGSTAECEAIEAGTVCAVSGAPNGTGIQCCHVCGTA
jgi:hypothetical protein